MKGNHPCDINQTLNKVSFQTFYNCSNYLCLCVFRYHVTHPRSRSWLHLKRIYDEDRRQAQRSSENEVMIFCKLAASPATVQLFLSDAILQRTS